MSRTSIAALTAAVAAVLLSACGTTPEEQSTTPAPVEEPRSATQAQTQPLQRAPATRAEIATAERAAASAPKDARGIPTQRSVYYDYDNFDIKDEYRAVIAAHAKYLRDNPGAKVLIEGHADERGSREYNVALGQRRAESVRKMSALLGVAEGRIEAVSLGEEKPVCTDQAEQCWWKNRRSDIRYASEQ
jgi:peptidoglycan-associated lipoprotein